MNAQNDRPAVVPVDLIRVIAIVGVVLLHAANDLTSQSMGLPILRWWMVDIYQSFGRMGVPLFLMLSGVLLLAPSKRDESLNSFFKKRFSRIGLPFLFWSIIYFLWVLYVEKQPFTQDFIINGILGGPHLILWYLYMLIGLYLITPILRVLVAHFTDALYKYFICIWSIGVMLTPLIDLASIGRYQISENLFVIPLFVGYFIIGTYLVNVKVRRRILAVLTLLGITLTAIGTCILAICVGGGGTYFFQQYFSPTLILASLPFFMLLISYAKPKDAPQMEKPSWKQRLIRTISENTLPIYLLHMIIIYLLQNGFFFGFTLTGNTVNSIIGVPLMTVLTIAICLIIIVPLKKMPGIRKLVG